VTRSRGSDAAATIAGSAPGLRYVRGRERLAARVCCHPAPRWSGRGDGCRPERRGARVVAARSATGTVARAAAAAIWAPDSLGVELDVSRLSASSHVARGLDGSTGSTCSSTTPVSGCAPYPVFLTTPTVLGGHADGFFVNVIDTKGDRHLYAALLASPSLPCPGGICRLWELTSSLFFGSLFGHFPP